MRRVFLFIDFQNSALETPVVGVRTDHNPVSPPAGSDKGFEPGSNPYCSKYLVSGVLLTEAGPGFYSHTT